MGLPGELDIQRYVRRPGELAVPLALLPGACAIVDLDLPGDHRAIILAANETFRAWCADGLDARRHGGIVRAMIELRRSEPRRESHDFVWDEPQFGGRSYDVALRRLVGGRMLLALNDRTRQSRSEAALKREAVSDELTGLPNRVGLIETLGEITPDDGRHALLLVDLARFSRINESIGALAGDELLLAAANRLRRALRQGDTLARIGADEFAILLKLREDDAEALAIRLLALFEDPFRIGELRLAIEAAVGGLSGIVAGELGGPEEWLRRAQIGLKDAKRSGQSPRFYAAGRRRDARARLDCESALRSAIEQGGIECAFQPLVDLPSRRIVGFESLARWRRDGESVTPDKFIPIAEESGLIVPLGRLVLQRALATLAEWDALAGGAVPLHVAVNVSALQLLRDDLGDAVDRAAAQAGVGVERLVVEMTESAIVADPERAEAVFRDLARRGVRVAMDDFGTGYSNIASLSRLPIDTLKIDRSLIAGVEERDDARAIVRTIQSLADALGMRTTAEGIESEAVAREIAEIGCHHGQGYLFARPLSPSDAWRAIAA